jgi:two-component system, sensor histidine kinase FlrB
MTPSNGQDNLTSRKDNFMNGGSSQLHKVDWQSDLPTVLDAWNQATVRLEQTHETLRREVHRLTCELEVKNRELARKNRLTDLGQIASHVAHEVRNSLVPVTLYMSLLRRRLSEDSGSCDILDKIASGFAAVDSCVNDLLHFAADRDPRLECLDARRLLADLLDSLRPQLEAQHIEATIDVPTPMKLRVDREMLRRAVLNLCLNAIDAMPDGGALTLAAYQTPTGIELEVADTGPGLTDEARRRAFEPFFSTKSHGTGLGLAIVSRVVEVHGGTCIAQNCPDGGAAFTLRIPQRVMEAAA